MKEREQLARLCVKYITRVPARRINGGVSGWYAFLSRYKAYRHCVEDNPRKFVDEQLYYLVWTKDERAPGNGFISIANGGEARVAFHDKMASQKAQVQQLEKKTGS